MPPISFLETDNEKLSLLSLSVPVQSSSFSKRHSSLETLSVENSTVEFFMIKYGTHLDKISRCYVDLLCLNLLLLFKATNVAIRDMKFVCCCVSNLYSDYLSIRLGDGNS